MRETKNIVESRDVVWMSKRFDKFFNVKGVRNVTPVEEEDSDNEIGVTRLVSEIKLEETTEPVEDVEEETLSSEIPPSMHKRRRMDSDDDVEFVFIGAVVLDPKEPKTFNQAWNCITDERDDWREAIRKELFSINLINLTTISKSPRIQRWQLTIEEFGPDLEYVNGPRNVVADALRRLDTEMSHLTYNSDTFPELFENSDGKSLTIDYPLSTSVIAKHQRKDKNLVRHIKRHPEYFTERVDGHGIILLNNKIHIPRALRKEILKWYHTTLPYPGIIRTEKSI